MTTKTAQFTPGPWSLCNWMVGNNTPTGEVTICGPEGDEHICTMDGNEDNQANGNLIAAAPAMYAAMGDLISLFDMRLPNGLALNQVLPKEVWERVSTVVSMAKQVKAQAEGR